MGEPLIFGPDARPNSHAARRLAPPCRFPSVPPCPSPKTYILPSVSFHTLGLSLFPRPWPNRCFRPARHGEPLVFSPNARPNSHAAPSPSCPSPKAYVAASVSLHTLGLGFFFGRARTHAGLRPRCALAVSVRKTGAPLPCVRNLVARRCVEWGEGRIRATRGWILVDHGSKATLPLTMPRRVLSRLQRIQHAARWEGSFEAARRGASAGRAEPMARALGARTP